MGEIHRMGEIDELLTKKEVMAWLKVEKSTLANWIRDKGFPPPILLGGCSPRFRRSQVEGWIEKSPSDVAPS